MAWQIAIVVDRGEAIETLHANIYILLGQMPVWAIAANGRVPRASESRESWDNCWHPEPALTIAAPSSGNVRYAEVLDLIPTIQEHHPRMCALRLFGIEDSKQLTDGLTDLGFAPLSGSTWDGLGFATPVSQVPNVRAISLDATEWSSTNDFFDMFFKAVGAPVWHGRNLDALGDSIGGGGINKTEVPYRIVVRNLGLAAPEAKNIVKEFAALIANLQANGCPVEMRIE